MPSAAVQGRTVSSTPARSRPRAEVRARPLARALPLLVALLVLVPTAAAAVLPVEPYAPYQPQTKCKPAAKPGTAELARWLQKTYQGTGSLGISRHCHASGVSEHKEGRAFDWAVNHSSARDRDYVKKFLTRIFATDKEGNEHALARRMGIMYLIWNDRIYSSYRQFEPRPYLSSACRTKKKCSVALRHRDHVHISLSRAGGRGDTSWYHRNDPQPPPPDPEPEPEPEPEPPADPVLNLAKRSVGRVSVPLDGSGRTTGFLLEGGRTYQLTAAGLYTYGSPHEVADAGCAWSRSAGAWKRRPDRKARVGSLNLKVNGGTPFDGACRPGRHVYSTKYTPQRTEPLRLRIAGRRLDASGKLVVAVSRPGTDLSRVLPQQRDLHPEPRATEPVRGHGLLSETVQVDAARLRTRTTQELRKGVDYRVTVSGTASLGKDVTVDARCISVTGRWFRQASLDRRVPDADHGNLYVDGKPFAGRPTGRGCTGHTYVTELTARRTARLELGLWDPLERGDNSGHLTVRVQRLTPIATPAAAEAERPRDTKPWTRTRDWFEVSSATARGALSTMRLRRGEQVRIAVRGTHSSHGVSGDASCVRVEGTWQPADPRIALAQDPLDLWVDGQPVRWRALGASAGCSAEHGYLTTYVARRNGPLRLAVLDLDHGDNRGTLQVTLLRGG